ncbi:MAG: ATP-binding protein [Prevotellaceae bacterium]|jgi:hypothetical protein|nr:ATP-binding protein [Prevotellaceae bacterium]
MKRIKRALTFKNIIQTKIKCFDFEGEWAEAFGTPQGTGVWFIFGNSGHGKTSFTFMLVKYLCHFTRSKIFYNSLDEGCASVNLQRIINRLGLLQENTKVILEMEDLEAMRVRLLKKHSPDIIFIDGLKMTEFATLKQVADYTSAFPRKLFIIIGQAKGRRPESRLAAGVLQYANQKIWVEGFRAISRGRSTGEKGYLTIWDEKAENYWGDKSVI